MAQAIYGMGVIVGPTLGPPLGGYITEMAGWPYIFYINIPLGIIATLLTFQFVRSPQYVQKSAMKDIDWIGIGLLAIFVGSLQYVLEKGHDDDWFASSTIIFFTATAIFGGFFFIWRQLTFRNPVVQLKVLKNGNLRVGTILSFILGFGLYGSTFIIPLYTQQILGWTPTQAGMLMVPAALTTAFLMPFMGKMLQKGARPNLLISLGMLIFFFFCFWGHNVLTPDTPKSAFFWPLIMRGIAMALLFIPITMMSLSTLKGRQIGDGAAFTGMMRQLGGSFGIAIITTFMAQQMVVHRSTLVNKLDVNNPVVMAKVNGFAQVFIRAGKSLDEAKQMALKAIDLGVTKQAAVLSFMDVFLYIGIMFLICIPFVMLVKSKKKEPAKLDMSNVH